MRAVNLLPRDIKRANGGVENLPALVAACAGVLVVALLAGMYLLENSKVASAQRGLDAAKTELAATPLPPAAPKALPLPPAVAAVQQPLLAAVSSALSQRIAWDRILREFSLVLPNDVWLSSLTLTTPPPGPLSTTGVALVGTTYSYDSVARLLSRLSLVPDLGQVTLASTSRTGRLIQFTVNAGVKGAPLAPTVAPPPTATTSTTPGASS
ncbi:MAG TPA: PilN domain-containing protein [Gaiellaceae bacterium]|nr:PilN domain-containing protein [Gaiellaceae bacterium]